MRTDKTCSAAVKLTFFAAKKLRLIFVSKLPPILKCWFGAEERFLFSSSFGEREMLALAAAKLCPVSEMSMLAGRLL